MTKDQGKKICEAMTSAMHVTSLLEDSFRRTTPEAVRVEVVDAIENLTAALRVLRPMISRTPCSPRPRPLWNAPHRRLGAICRVRNPRQGSSTPQSV